MFGKEYAKHLDILTQSFGEINEAYQKKINRSKGNPTFVDTVKKIYILLFGIPEIGFQIRAIYFKKILTTFLRDKNIKDILDAGSGIGAYTFWLGKKFDKAQVTGGDIDKQKLNASEEMNNKLHIKNVRFTYLDITKIEENSVYDLIVTIDVLEHIEKPELVLKNFYRLLRNNGYLYIHVPQPNQKRIFFFLKTWRHQDHIREGIAKNDLEKVLKKLGFRILVSRETFGFFGKLGWEINHLTLPKNFVIAGIIFPFLYILSQLDELWKNKNGLGVAVLAQKI